MASINNIVTATLLPDRSSALPDNPNIICVMTSEQGVLSTAERYRSYIDAQSVESDFGSASAVTAYANTIFGTVPNATQVGGRLIVGFFRKTEESVDATHGVLLGAQINPATVVAQLQEVSAGSFAMAIDGGASADYSGIDFRTAGDIDDVIDLINDELSTAATAELTSDNRIKIVSATDGATSAVTVMSEAAAGTFIGTILGLAAGTGAVATAGAASGTLSAEDEIAALAAVKAEVNFKGVCFIDAIADADVPDVAAWCQANSVLGYQVFSGSGYYAKLATNPVWANKLASRSYYRTLYRADGDRKFAATYMAMVHTVNFSAENSAMTIHGKVLNIASEDLSQTVIDSCEQAGLDVYISTKNTPWVKTSGANDYVDNVYNLTAYLDAVQTAAFNRLTNQEPRKVPQTTDGVNALLSALSAVSRQFVRAGAVAPGTWTSGTFGNAESFKRAIEQDGYFWLPGTLADQPVADRAARKSPVMQNAIKLAGAFHSVDIIIQYNR